MGGAFHSSTPLWAFLSALAAVVPLVAFRRKPNLREATTLLAGLAMFGFVVSMVPAVLAGRIPEFQLFQLTEDVPLVFRVDGPGLLFALVASGLWIVTSVFSIGYMRGLHEHSQTRFYTFFAVSLAATIGVAFAGNLLTMYLFYEMLSLSTWPLVTHHQDMEARSAGRKYLAHLVGTSVGLALPAVTYCYVKSPDSGLEFSAAGFLAAENSRPESGDFT